MRFKFVATVMILAGCWSAVEANTLSFPGTPIKDFAYEGDWSRLDAKPIDPSVGTEFYDKNSPDRFGVFVLNAKPTYAVQKIIAGKAGTVDADDLRTLSDKDSPWILRSCAERGKPEILLIGKHKYLITSYAEDQRMAVQTPKGRLCIPAAKYEAHAFTVSDGKLIHLYLNRGLREEANQNLVASLTDKFKRMLSAIAFTK